MSSHLLSRRAILPLILLSLAPRIARADNTVTAVRNSSHVVRTASDEKGLTVWLDLEHAPFPAPGAGYQDRTVIVFIPKHHRPDPKGVNMVVHFHGHNSTAERAMVAHQLREQLFDSKQNAILVVPELAVMAPDSSAGKLDLPGGFERMVGDVLVTLQGVKTPLLPMNPAPGRIVISAHSGGYHSAASSLRNGAHVHEVWLFDALYGEHDVFRDWVIAGKGKPMGSRHKLISFFTAGTTEATTQRLFAELTQAGVDCVHEKVEGTLSREQLTLAEAVSIRTSLTHGAVTSELNSLRDCLYASALPRRLRTSWFDTKQGARPLERRR